MSHCSCRPERGSPSPERSLSAAPSLSLPTLPARTPPWSRMTFEAAETISRSNFGNADESASSSKVTDLDSHYKYQIKALSVSQPEAMLTSSRQVRLKFGSSKIEGQVGNFSASAIRFLRPNSGSTSSRSRRSFSRFSFRLSFLSSATSKAKALSNSPSLSPSTPSTFPVT